LGATESGFSRQLVRPARALGVHRFGRMMRTGPHQVLLDGLAVLVVEDESIISFLLEDMLVTLGCADIFHAASVTTALSRIDDEPPDIAVLDVNLAGEPVFPVAEALDGLRVPFLFATGYGASGLPVKWAAHPVVQKPFTIEGLQAALGAVLRAPQRTGGA
jgi:DNA-binding response OmpR family regulator